MDLRESQQVQRGKAPRQHRPDQSPQVRISRNLSKILRHRAGEVGLTVRQDGFVKVDELLKNSQFKNSGLNVEMLQEIVQQDAKGRFSLIEENDPSAQEGVLLIRANQGHSIPVNECDLLEEVTNPDELPVVVHGTYLQHWESISRQGLKIMSRNHIHCSSGLLGEDGVTSGMRKSCNLYIYIDARKAMEDGIEFYRSANGVILTSGKNGVLSPSYFSKVVRKDGQLV